MEVAAPNRRARLDHSPKATRLPLRRSCSQSHVCRHICGSSAVQPHFSRLIFSPISTDPPPWSLRCSLWLIWTDYESRNTALGYGPRWASIFFCFATKGTASPKDLESALDNNRIWEENRSVGRRISTLWKARTVAAVRAFSFPRAKLRTHWFTPSDFGRINQVGHIRASYE